MSVTTTKGDFVHSLKKQIILHSSLCQYTEGNQWTKMISFLQIFRKKLGDHLSPICTSSIHLGVFRVFGWNNERNIGQIIPHRSQEVTNIFPNFLDPKVPHYLGEIFSHFNHTQERRSVRRKPITVHWNASGQLYRCCVVTDVANYLIISPLIYIA